MHGAVAARRDDTVRQSRNAKTTPAERGVTARSAHGFAVEQCLGGARRWFRHPAGRPAGFPESLRELPFGVRSACFCRAVSGMVISSSPPASKGLWSVNCYNSNCHARVKIPLAEPSKASQRSSVRPSFQSPRGAPVVSSSCRAGSATLKRNNLGSSTDLLPSNGDFPEPHHSEESWFIKLSPRWMMAADRTSGVFIIADREHSILQNPRWMRSRSAIWPAKAVKTLS
jgi:hypothetical protein